MAPPLPPSAVKNRIKDEKMKDEDQVALATLELRLSRKFDEIAEMISTDIGYGPLAALTEAQRQQVYEDAEEATESWDEADIAASTSLKVNTPLQKLLQEHLDMAEAIMDIRDADIANGSEGD
jgi:hypothetical protein